MTRPTKEQIDALKPGDRVLVEATVLPDRADGDIMVRVPSCLDGHATEPFWISAPTIHSILPREIKVGDRVRDRTGEEWEVAHGPRDVGGRLEVALWRDGYGYDCAYVKDLTVIA